MSTINSLRQATRSLITLVEAETGKQVVVQQDSQISTFATVTIARNQTPMHMIKYRPIPREEPDYLICYQCGFVLRKYAVAEEYRVDFGASTAGRQIATRLLTSGQSKKRQLPPEHAQKAANQLLDGLLIHLLSTPIGLRVGEWLRTDYPDLIPLQDRQVVREIKVSEKTNTPEVKRTVPKKIFDTTQAINAAYALYWAEATDQPDLTERFSAYLRDGEALLEIARDIPDGPEYDTTLVDAWADHLHISEWYQWIPFQP